MDSPYSAKRIRDIAASPSPRVLLNVCTHGTERVGLKVAAYFEKKNMLCGTLVINCANTKALAQRKRFITHDLNRIFPGKKNGSHEERLAFAMTPFIKAFDIVIDVHSTETGLDSTLIVTRMSPQLKPLIRAIAPERVVYMKATRMNALISMAKLGVGFEYGKDKDPRTYRETVRGIERLLAHYKMLKPTKTALGTRKRSNFFEAFDTLPKPPGYIVQKEIVNFKRVRKGDVVGFNPKTSRELRSRMDFYPILFGKNSYKKVFGFRARKKKLV